jgi:hypothetical protein
MCVSSEANLQRRHGLVQIVLVHTRELLNIEAHINIQSYQFKKHTHIHPTLNQEALKPLHPRLHKRHQIPFIPRHDTSPEPNIDPALPLRRLPFSGEIRYGSGGRDRVERHVDERGDPARGGGAGAGPEPLPFGASGLVEVDVGTVGTCMRYLWWYVWSSRAECGRSYGPP